MQKLKEYYPSLDGLRSVAAFAIVAMHTYANSAYDIDGWLVTNVITTFENFVLLFMMISSYSMCCGYYDKMQTGELSMALFYEKRFKKIWPFFAMLVIIDLILQHDLKALVESFANLTLCFSLLPNPAIEVIGVGWFLGVVFLFYMLFPFFCCLLKNKKRAWGTFIISIIYHVVCVEYFFDGEHVIGRCEYRNFLWCAMFFVVGGLIYMYRHTMIKCNKILLLLIATISSLVYFSVDNIQEGYYNNFWLLFTFSLWLIYAIITNGKVLVNPITKFLSGISMEIYLSHMLIFRVLEKLNLIYILGKGWMAYVMTVLLVLCGAILFSLLVNKFVFPLCKKMLKELVVPKSYFE